MQSYYTYPAAESSSSTRRQCSSAPAVPTPQQEYYYSSWEASASYASLYDPYSFAPPQPPPPQSLDIYMAEEPSSPMSPLSESDMYPYTPGIVAAPESHSVYPAHTQTSFDNTEVWPHHGEWPYVKHASSYDAAVDYTQPQMQTGICVFQDGSYHNVDSVPIPVSDYYYQDQDYAAASPLSPGPLSDPSSQWCQHATESQTFTLLPSPAQSHSSASSISIASPNPDPIPLHQPRPTRRFNYQMMNDIAASLEASASLAGSLEA